MRWPTRVLGMPRAALRALRGFVRLRAGLPPVESEEPPKTHDPLEYIHTVSGGETDQDLLPTPVMQPESSGLPTKPGYSSRPPKRRPVGGRRP